jgi:AcrR family transcriptional regulator
MVRLSTTDEEIRVDVRERSDAARNRQRILEAADRLFAEHGAERVSMDAIAVAAGVGKGTLFRRFGDRTGLARAVLEQRDGVLRQAVLSGPPPLGPGAPAADRLAAFLGAAADHICRNRPWLLAYEQCSGVARYGDDPNRFWQEHVADLVAEARPDLDARFLAHALLAPLNCQLVQHLVEDAGMPPERIRQGAVRLARTILASP